MDTVTGTPDANREKFRDDLAATTDAYDQAILKLSAGGLGLSLVFVRFLVQEPVHVWTLYAAWMCWTASSASMIAAYLVTMRVLYLAIDGKRISPWANWWIGCLNVGAGGLYLAGIAAFVIFVWANVGRTMPRKTTDVVGVARESDAGMRETEYRSRFVIPLVESDAPAQPDRGKTPTATGTRAPATSTSDEGATE